MTIIGIVAEYNPFHHGHAYHIDKTREMAGDCAVVSVMSGDFVQRGEAAAYDKHVRARAAVMGGANLVLELPLPWSVASAESFARGAVGLLGALGVVDRLSFGSECGGLGPLLEAAQALLAPGMNRRITEALTTGAPYAAARQKALEDVLGESAAVISRPNNILGVEYLKAIITQKLPIDAMTVARIGAGHDEPGTDAVRSASEIRRIMDKGGAWRRFVPETANAVYASAQPIDRERFETALLARLRWLGPDAFRRLPDASEGLGNRLYRAVHEGRTIDEILAIAKSRRYALSRLRRMLLCAALGVTKEMSRGTPDYARVLAADETGLRLLAEMQKKSRIPIITKPAHGRRLTGRAGECFGLTAAARDFYTLSMPAAEFRTVGGDWRTTPHIIHVNR